MAKNDAIAIDTLKLLITKLSHIAIMKSRGLPQDHIDVAEMAQECVDLVNKFKHFMDEDAAQYTNLPENVVPFLRPTAH